MKKIIKFLCFMVLLISCKEELEDNSGTYISQNIEIGDIKLYTKYGEIKDSKTIYNFINAHDNRTHYFIQNRDSDIYVPNLYKVLILPTDQAKFINFGDSTIYNIKNKNHILYLESKDTTQYANEEITPFYAKMLVYSPIYSETFAIPLSGGSKYSSITKYKRCIYMFLANNTITYPLLTYHYFQSFNNGESYSSLTCQNINNCFNEESTKLLKVTDTIAIQQNKLNFIK